MLLYEIVEAGASHDPGVTALIFRDQETSYGQLLGAIEAVGRGLAALGIRPGERIGLLLPNCPPFVWFYYAASKVGAVVVPVNPLLKPAELQYIWNDSGIRLVVTVGPLLPLVQAVRGNLPALTHVICATPRAELTDAGMADGVLFLPEMLSAPPQSAAEAAKAGATPSASPDTETSHESSESKESKESNETEPGGQDATGENDCAVIIYTSGTTGHPKGAMLSHRNLIRNVEQIRAVLKFSPEDRFVTVLPMFHAFAATVCMNACLNTGCASILFENFAPGRTLEAIERHGGTIFPAVPALFNAILAYQPERKLDLSALRLFVSGGAPLPEPTLRALEATFPVPVLEGDGPTECSPVTSVNPLDGVRKVGSVGPALPGVEVAIWDDENRPLGVDEVGEIVVRGDNVMLGYLNQPEATAEAMSGGWYHTGDIGKIDADGYIYILDRKKDMIITAGFNVYPREVEDVLLSHPGVADVAVIGQPDGTRGEDVLAVVVRKAVQEGDEPVLERDLIRFCRERLANYKVPRKVLFRDTLPRGGTGKVVKRLLRKELDLGG